MLSWEKPLVKPMAPGSIVHRISFQSILFCNLYFPIYTTKIPKIFILLSLSNLTFACGREGIDNPFIVLVASYLFVCVGARDFWGASYWIDTLVLKNQGKYLRYFAASPFPLQGKINAVLKRQQEGFLAPLLGRSTYKSRHTKYPSQTLIPRITLFAICLSFSSPPLQLCRFLRPSSILLFVCLDVLLGSFTRLVGIVVYLLLNREPKIYGSLSAIFLRDPIMMNQLLVSFVH